MSHDNDHRLTYIHLGIIASLLLNSKAVDFVVSGCGTGQGALMSLNAHLVSFVVIVLILQTHIYLLKLITARISSSV